MNVTAPKPQWSWGKDECRAVAGPACFVCNNKARSLLGEPRQHSPARDGHLAVQVPARGLQGRGCPWEQVLQLRGGSLPQGAQYRCVRQAGFSERERHAENRRAGAQVRSPSKRALCGFRAVRVHRCPASHTHSPRDQGEDQELSLAQACLEPQGLGLGAPTAGRVSWFPHSAPPAEAAQTWPGALWSPPTFPALGLPGAGGQEATGGW